MNITKMPLAQFKLAPTHEARTHKVICVMTHKREAFYTVTPERMSELLEAEEKLNDIRELLDHLHSSGRLIYSDYSQLHDMT